VLIARRRANCAMVSVRDSTFPGCTDPEASFGDTANFLSRR
jgi:hypothetical protein